MTAIKTRRSRNTWLALVATCAALACAAALSIAGIRTLADSKAGRQVEGQAANVTSQRLPSTSTALVGTVDDDGRLTSVVVLALNVNGLGGSIVSLSPSADTTSGNADELRPLNAVLAVEGPEAFRFAVEGVTGLSFDVIELVDQERFVQLVTPLGDMPVILPTPLHDESSAEQWPKGQVVMSAPAAARAVTAVDSTIADWYLDPGRSAVWKAIADRVGAGIGSAPSDAVGAAPGTPRALDDFVNRLFASNLDYRSMTIRVLDEDQIADELPAELSVAFGAGAVDSVVVHDRAEMLMVVAAIAPGRVGAPSSAPTFRVVTAFQEADLTSLGMNNADVTKRVIDGLLFIQVNVVSVSSTANGTVPMITLIEVADPTVISAIEESYPALFGEIEVREADVVIEGVDIIVTVGRSFLETLRSESSNTVAGSLDDDSTATSDTTGNDG